MKRLATWGLVLSAALLLGSCYWNPGSGAGKITLNLKSSPRSMVDPSAVQYARVYLYGDNMNSSINIGDGTPYVETTLGAGGGSVTVDHVPAGNGYEVVLTLGSKPNGTTYVPGQFGTSAEFDVTAGHETDVNIPTMTAIGSFAGTGGPLQYDAGLLGRNITGVAAVLDSATQGIYIGATDANTLYTGTVFPLSSVSGTLPGGRTASSVTSAPAKSEFLVSTNRGIVPYTAAGQSASIPIFSTPTAPVGPVSSTAYSSANLDTYYFRTPDGALGGVTNAIQGPGVWFGVDLSSGGSNQIVFDIGTGSTDSNTFFTTSAGAYAVSTELLSSGNNSLSYMQKYGANLTVSMGSRDLFIASIGVGGDGNLYAATSDGIYAATAATVDGAVGSSSTGKPGSTLDLVKGASGTLLSGSSGHPFSKVAVSDGSSGLVAGVSNNLLYVSEYGMSYSVPLAAVALGTVNAVAVDPNGTFVVIAGTEGLTLLSVALG